MKKHAIIPIFIPHLGCPHDCIFCNQRSITARTGRVSIEDVRRTMDRWLTTLSEVETIEVAFYGGSFTGIPMEQQSAYLEVAKEYKDKGKIGKIHLSTRPDYIDEKILANLKRFTVDTIELGVQSFDDRVLAISERGHDSAQAEAAARAVKDQGFELGIQLMIGLPGDTKETALCSAKKTAELKPELARLYPTVILKDTELARRYRQGKYVPPTQEEMVETTKEMYKILAAAGITIMRVGLKSTDVIAEGADALEGAYHPAFRQLVEGRIARESIERELERRFKDAVGKPGSGTRIGGSGAADKGRSEDDDPPPGVNKPATITIISSPGWVSNVSGHGGENRKYFKEKYPHIRLIIREDETLGDGQIKVE